MANLHFHYGTMGSSKSAALIINAHNQNQTGNKVEIIMPATDTRSGAGVVKSRIGISAPAIARQNIADWQPRPDTKMILVDEVQFFTPDDIDCLVRVADGKNIIVMCYGLMVDSNEKLFPASKRLIEVGAKLHRLESTCQIDGCMKLATHHLRFDASGNVVRQGAQIAVGDSNYKSVCRQHFNMLYHGVAINTKTK